MCGVCSPVSEQTWVVSLSWECCKSGVCLSVLGAAEILPCPGTRWLGLSGSWASLATADGGQRQGPSRQAQLCRLILDPPGSAWLAQAANCVFRASPVCDGPTSLSRFATTLHNRSGLELAGCIPLCLSPGPSLGGLARCPEEAGRTTVSSAPLPAGSQTAARLCEAGPSATCCCMCPGVPGLPAQLGPPGRLEDCPSAPKCPSGRCCEEATCGIYPFWPQRPPF